MPWTRWKKAQSLAKLRIGVSCGFILAHYLSKSRKTNGEIKSNLSHHLEQINSIIADKVYDQMRVYEIANDQMNKWDQLNIHLKANAVISATDEVTLR